MSDAREPMHPDEAIPTYRCLAVSLRETTIYFRHYAAHWFYAARNGNGVWEETAVAPEVPELVCRYYPHHPAPLSEHPI
jgi:hypothetical protein